MTCLDTLSFEHARFACRLPDDHGELHEAVGMTGGRAYVIQWARDHEVVQGEVA